MNRVRHNVTIDEDVWQGSKKVIESEVGMSMSKYVEIMLRGLMRANSGTAKDFIQDTIMDMYHATEKKPNKQK